VDLTGHAPQPLEFGQAIIDPGSHANKVISGKSNTAV
jgi:hypothetical protein